MDAKSSFLLWSKHTVLKYSSPSMLRRKHLMSKAASESSKIRRSFQSPENRRSAQFPADSISTFRPPTENTERLFRGLFLSYKGAVPLLPSQENDTLMDDMRWAPSMPLFVHSWNFRVLFFCFSPPQKNRSLYSLVLHGHGSVSMPVSVDGLVDASGPVSSLVEGGRERETSS